MFLTLLTLYAGSAAVYWGVKYAKTKEKKDKDDAVAHLGKSYLDCLLWPADLVRGVSGFTGEPDDKDKPKGA